MCRDRRRDRPQRGADGLYACTSGDPDCVNSRFARRCEWHKHMDRHERPYHCPEPSCTKLLGFTYSGGLLRHEREVHGKHGGPKEKLACPVVECKRHDGRGFTRRENLTEHLRRVHKRDMSLTSDASDQIGGPVKQASSPTVIRIPVTSATDDVKHEDDSFATAMDVDDDPSGKRRRDELVETEAESMQADEAELTLAYKKLRMESTEQAAQIQALLRQLDEAQAKLNGQFRPV